MSRNRRTLFVPWTIAGLAVAANLLTWYFAHPPRDEAKPAQSPASVPVAGDPSFSDFVDDERLKTHLAELGPDVQFFGHSATPLHMTKAAIAEKPVDSNDGSVPGTLPLPHDAAPIGSRITVGRSELQQLLQREMPHASPEERRVWEEELQGLPLEMIREILSLRGHVKGREASDAPPPIRPDVDRPSFNPDDVPGDSQPTLAALRAGRRIVLHNLQNEKTAGFRSLRIVWRDAAVGAPNKNEERTGGLRMAGTLLRTYTGPLVGTERALDVAIDGPGFFRVAEGDTTLYTRAGSLMIDSANRLAVMCSDRPKPLIPSVSIPSDAAAITIEPTGRVTAAVGDDQSPLVCGDIHLTHFLDATALQPHGDGFYAAVPPAGRPSVGRPDGDRLGHLKQGMIEQSNVNGEEERARLHRIDDQIQRLTKAFAPPVELFPESDAPIPVARKPRPTGKAQLATQRSLIDEFLDRTRLRAIKRTLEKTAERP